MDSKRSSTGVAIALLLAVGLATYILKQRSAAPPESPAGNAPHSRPAIAALPETGEHESAASAPGSAKFYTPVEFDTLLQTFRSEIPSMKILRAQPKHAQHPGLIAIYQRSGIIARAAIRQPELREAAFEALEYCANLKNYDLSARAMCLRQHRKIRASTSMTFDERNRFEDLETIDRLLQRSFPEDASP